jgi:4-hydroxy 2-oxovalerate aldolase
MMAVAAGAVQIDGSTRSVRRRRRQHAARGVRRRGRAPGHRTGLDVLAMIDVAEDVVRPVMDGECVLDRLAIIMGYAGVYSSLLKHAYRAAERYGVSGAEILMECGRQGWSAARRTRSSRSPPS